MYSTKFWNTGATKLNFLIKTIMGEEKKRKQHNIYWLRRQQLGMISKQYGWLRQYWLKIQYFISLYTLPTKATTQKMPIEKKNYETQKKKNLLPLSNNYTTSVGTIKTMSLKSCTRISWRILQNKNQTILNNTSK